MAAPYSQFDEVDLSTRVPGFNGIYGCIVLPNAAKGEVNTPKLISNETQFLKQFTPDERLELGYDLAYFSALAYLQGSDKLWVIRPDDGSTYGGLTVTAGASPALTTAAATIPDPQSFVFTTGQALLFTGKDPGKWNNDLSIELADNSAKEPDSFLVKVFKRLTLVETHIVSRIQGKLDGYNRNIYIEEVLKSSNYVRAVDNLAVASNLALPYGTRVALSKGANGSAATDGALILALDKMKNRDAYPLTLILSGGRSTPAYHSAIDTLAQYRKDCIGITVTPFSAEANSDYLNELLDFRKSDSNLNSSYSALYSCHVKIYDKFNSRELFVSPDGYIGAAISNAATNQEIWFPVGGFRRGVLSVLDTHRRFEKGEMDALYDAGINPIRFKAGRGIVIWGQKTQSARPSSLDRLNVRLMLIVVEPAIADALEDYVFEINDASTRSLIRGMIDSYMSNIKARRGVYDYRIKCDDENNVADDIDNNRLNVWLFVKPTKSAEYIELKTIITPTGISFELAEQAL